MSLATMLRGQAARLLVGSIALGLFLMARATGGPIDSGDTGLRFATLPLGTVERSDDRKLRTVNPRYEHIRGWISAVGAGVALADIDGDGRPNDICLVETRDDSVTVLPVPGTGDRYAAFSLQVPADGYEDGTVAPMGCLPGDYDEDGATDLLVYFWGRPPLIYLANGSSLAPGHFRSTALVAAHEPWYTNAAIQADVDGDGHTDLLFGNYFPEDARVLDAAATDGGTMQRSMSRAFNGGRNRLFLREPATGGGSGFIDHSSALSREMANGWTLALAAADLDADLLPEIYVANDFGPDRLLVNLSEPGAPRFALAAGRRAFATPRSRTLGRDSFKGMGAEFADVNGDGRLDLAVSNIAQDYALLESHFLFINQGRPDLLKRGVARFVDESGPRGTARTGWGWDIKAADFDNDSKPELIQALGFLAGAVDRWPQLQELAMANDDLLARSAVWPVFTGDADLSGHARIGLYAQGPGGAYRDIGVASGLSGRGVVRGLAVADVDFDGRLDAAVARQWGRSVLLMNRTARIGSFLSLDLRLPNTNGGSRPAIGATVRAARAGSPPLIAVVDGGNGHSGKSAPLVHFGLGRGRGPATVLIEWRDRAGRHRARLTVPPGHHRIVLGRKTA